MKGEVGESPELMSNCAKAFGINLIEIEHVDEVLRKDFIISQMIRPEGVRGGKGDLERR